MENWKDIAGFEGKYQVSDLGRVKCLGYYIEVTTRFKTYTRSVSAKIINGRVNNFGYLVVELQKGNAFQVHRLVAEAFIPNPESKRTVNHIDGNKQNNSLSNLEWNTYSENIVHAYKTGLKTVKKGSDHHHYGKCRGESINKKLVLDRHTGIYYDCLKDAADSLGLKYKTLSSWMCNQRLNRTNLIYV